MEAFMRRTKNKRRRAENVPEIFKDLWGFNFIEEINISRIKNELWPKIKIVISRTEEDKIKSIKIVMQKYEFPFANAKIVVNSGKKEREINTAEHYPSIMLKANKIATKPTMGRLGERKLPPFHCI